MIESIKWKLVVIVALLGMIGATIQPLPAECSWFYTVTPPLGGPPFVVGYYDSDRGCADWLGSAMYLHPSACHNHPTSHNCRIIGDGYAYPKGWPFPTDDITSGACVSSGHSTSTNRYWFYWYNSIGGSTVGGTRDASQCEALRRQYLSSNRPGDAGTTCFFVGSTGE